MVLESLSSVQFAGYGLGLILLAAFVLLLFKPIQKIVGVDKKKDKRTVLLGALLVGGLLLGGFGQLSALNVAGGVTGSSVSAQADVAEEARSLSCDGVSSVTISTAGRDMELPATTVTPTRAYYFAGFYGNQSGTSLAVTPATKGYEALFGFGGISNYYPMVYDYDAGCSNKQLTLDFPRASAATVTFINQNGATVNAAGSADAMGAASTYTGTMKVDASADRYWGLPGKECNIVVWEWDATDFTTIDMPGRSSAPIPNLFAYKNSSFDSSRAFYLPSSDDGETNEFDVEFKTNGNPAGATGHPTAQLFDCSRDVNEETGQLIEGVEDEDVRSLSLNPVNATYYIS